MIKEEYNKEIERYKDIIKQKDIKINEINNEINNKISNDKINLDKILSLQKEISELKVENNKLYLNNKELQNKKKEKEKEKEKDRESIVFLIKDPNKEKIKDAYRILIKENEELKNNILKLKEYHH